MDQSRYKLRTNFTLSPEEYQALVILYQPVFSYPALSLYLTLYELGRVQDEVEIADLMRVLDLKRDDLTRYRIELERFSLLRTFEDRHLLTLVVQKPLSPHDFMQHPSYARLFHIVMGHEAFIEQVHRFQKDRIPSGKDITHRFDLNRLAIWDQSFEEKFQSEGKANGDTGNDTYSADAFLRKIPLPNFPVELRTDDVKTLISQMASTYSLGFAELRSALYASTNLHRKTFDKKRFCYLIEKSKGKLDVEQVSDPYELDPVSFLRHIQGYDYVVQADERLLKSLQHNFKFSDEVINVLVEYVLKVNQNQLNRAYVEKIAAAWKREGVKTAKDAKGLIEGGGQPATFVNKNNKRQKVKRHVAMPEYSKETKIDEDVDKLKEELYDLLEKGDAK